MASSEEGGGGKPGIMLFLLLLFVHGCKIHRYPGLHRLALESLLSFSVFSMLTFLLKHVDAGTAALGHTAKWQASSSVIKQ